MIINLTSVLTVINFVVAIGIVIGGYIAVRFGLGHVSSEIQQRVRDGLHDENELLQTQLKRLEAKIEHLESMLETTAELLKEKGFTLTIGEDSVTLEGDGKVSSIKRRSRPVKSTLKPVPKKEEH